MNGNVLRSTVSRSAVFLLAAVFLAVFAGSEPTSADQKSHFLDAKVTFSNKTDRKIYLALCWSAGEKWEKMADGSIRESGPCWIKGWYHLEPGQTRTITIPNIMSPNHDDFGYYAKSSAAKGQKRYIWEGGSGNTVPRKTFVHPTENFKTNKCAMMKGGQLVKFRVKKLKVENGVWVGSVTFAVNNK